MGPRELVEVALDYGYHLIVRAVRVAPDLTHPDFCWSVRLFSTEAHSSSPLEVIGIVELAGDRFIWADMVALDVQQLDGAYHSCTEDELGPPSSVNGWGS
jgi:hypothetical protein